MEATEEKFINPYKLFQGAFIPNWLMQRTEISPSAKLCYAKLCQYAGKDGICFPKQEKIANNIGLKRRWIINCLNELETLRLIKSIRIGWRCSNRYKFLYHSWMGDVQDNALLDVHYNALLDVQDNALLKKENHKKENHKKDNNPLTPLKKGDVLLTSFERFWKEYPKKRSKGQAEKAWQKIKPSERLVEEIIQAVQRATTSADWQKDDGRYIPYPATWLNAKGWEDEIQTGKEVNADARFGFLKRHTKPGSGIQGPAP